MTPLEAFRHWAPPGAPWSAWAKPVLFTQMVSSDFVRDPQKPAAEPLPVPDAAAYPAPHERVALVLELPSLLAVELGVGLGRAGYQPVPLFNAASGIFRAPLLGVRERYEAVPVDALRRHLAQYAPLAADLPPAPDAPPAFLLDAGRMGTGHPPPEGHFDNRSYLLPQDFPSARMLRAAGLRRVLVVASFYAPPSDDLRHVLRRWQEDGLPIELCVVSEPQCRTALNIDPPPRFRRFWHVAFALLGLRSNSAGGFGDVVPSSSDGTGGG